MAISCFKVFKIEFGNKRFIFLFLIGYSQWYIGIILNEETMDYLNVLTRYSHLHCYGQNAPYHRSSKQVPTSIAREVNGVKQAYQYDQIGQLTTVLDDSGKAIEQYSYDPVGNILKKDLNGEITTYSYDKSNQLLSSTTNDKTTKYEYDAAGRMVKEGDKSYAYNWLNKVMSITENDKITNSYSYSVEGQIASATEQGKEENFIWDGLALIKRGNTDYVYEPAVTGGNPILANGSNVDSGVLLFNDMLGTTLGQYDGEKFTDNQRTSFGSGAKEGFFTGKPHVAGLGYAFLFRNYRSDLGKWQTSDPLGYPDGWNNLAYVNNGVMSFIDWLGAEQREVLKNTRIYTETGEEEYLGITTLGDVQYYAYRTPTYSKEDRLYYIYDVTQERASTTFITWANRVAGGAGVTLFLTEGMTYSKILGKIGGYFGVVAFAAEIFNEMIYTDVLTYSSERTDTKITKTTYSGRLVPYFLE